MIVSAMISQLRREVGDMPKATRAAQVGNGNINLFNTGKFPIVESSYTVYASGSTRTESTHYTIDLDSGDVQMVTTPVNGLEISIDFKYANWRDKNWVEAINQGVDALNARGFFKQIVRNTSIIRLSANIQKYNGPSACVDMYEFLVSDNYTTSGKFVKPQVNWSYQQDANVLLLGSKPTVANRVAISYLRNLQTYTATSATLDTLNDWNEIVKEKAKAIFYRSLAGKIAKQGHATVDEGHFSFTNLRAMANDHDTSFERLAARKKPTRPAKDLQYALETGGVA